MSEKLLQQLIANPSEDSQQAALFCWAALQVRDDPSSPLKWMHHIPNGGDRDIITAGKLKAAGVKAGIADVFLPRPMGRYAGLYIEMKKLDGTGVVSEKQKDFLAFAGSHWYAVTVCHGFHAAHRAIAVYLSGDEVQPEYRK